MILWPRIQWPLSMQVGLGGVEGRQLEEKKPLHSTIEDREPANRDGRMGKGKKRQEEGKARWWNGGLPRHRQRAWGPASSCFCFRKSTLKRPHLAPHRGQVGQTRSPWPDGNYSTLLFIFLVQRANLLFEVGLVRWMSFSRDQRLRSISWPVTNGRRHSLAFSLLCEGWTVRRDWEGLGVSFISFSFSQQLYPCKAEEGKWNVILRRCDKRLFARKRLCLK